MKRDDLRLSEYPFTIRPLTADEGGGYLIEFPDVPLCMSDGESEAEAIVNGRDALKCCLLSYKERGDPVPQPSVAAASSGQFRLRVPKSLHAWLTVRSAQEGVSLNTLAVALISEGRGKRESGSQNAKRARKTRAA
jgi:antitoxin HicB